MVAGKLPEWLPLGFTEKVKVKDGRKIKVYTDTSTGNKFYSKPAVIRYLETVDQSNTTSEQVKPEVVDEPSLNPEISLQSLPITSSGCTSEKANKGKHSFKMVASESESADGIPLGWIIENKMSKSGNKIRTDRYYIDPNSGYIFSSKKDVLRYLEARDISNCATRPKRMECDDLQLIKREIHSSSPDNNKLSEHIESESQLLAPGESDSGGESSSAKSPEEPDAKILETVQDNSARTLEDNESCENSNKDAEMKISSEPTEDVKAMDQTSVKTDSQTKQNLPSSGIDKQTDEAPASLRKSKKRKGLILPSRTSKRLAGCEVEVHSDLVPKKRAPRVAAMRSPGSDVKTLPSSSLETAAESSDASLSKEAILPIGVNETPPKEIEPLKNVEKPIIENEAIQDEKQAEDSTRSQDSQLCFEFGNSWPDPCLEFAFKTLTEEIPYEDTTRYFRDQFSIPFNHLNVSKPSDSDVQSIFQREIPPHSESLKQKRVLNLLSAKNLNFPTCSGVSSQQSSSEARNSDFPNLPASGTGKQTDKAPVSLRKSKKKEDISLPSRTLEKLTWSGTATTLEFVGDKTLQKVEPPNKVKKPMVETQAIPDNKHKLKDSVTSEESQHCYEFQSSWSDPCLEFAFKTLTGEIPVEDTFALSGRIGNQLGVPYNQAKDPIKPSESEKPTIFQNEIPPNSELLKKNNVIHLLPGNNISYPTCSGVSSRQSSSEVRNKEYQTKVSVRK